MATTIGMTTNGYDDAGRPSHTLDSSNQFSKSIFYNFDDANRLQYQSEDTSKVIDFDYDDIGQLTDMSINGVAVFDTTYDEAGNRNGSVVGTGNRVSDSGLGWIYSYDDAGQMTGKANSTLGQNWAYTYDLRGQLTLGELTFTGNDDTTSVAFDYDAFGNTIGRTERQDGVIVKEQHFVVDGWDPGKPTAKGIENFDNVMDLDGNFATTDRRLFGSGFDQPIAKIEADNDSTWYLSDRQGSIRNIMDDSGAIIASADYGAFGEITSTGALPERYGYTGQEWDATLSLMTNQARPYDPSTGRWLAEDPLGQAAGDANVYRYVSNSPSNGSDPSGLEEPKITRKQMQEMLIKAKEAKQELLTAHTDGKTRLSQLQSAYNALSNDILTLEATPKLKLDAPKWIFDTIFRNAGGPVIAPPWQNKSTRLSDDEAVELASFLIAIGEGASLSDHDAFMAMVNARKASHRGLINGEAISRAREIYNSDIIAHAFARNLSKQVFDRYAPYYAEMLTNAQSDVDVANFDHRYTVPRLKVGQSVLSDELLKKYTEYNAAVAAYDNVIDSAGSSLFWSHPVLVRASGTLQVGGGAIEGVVGALAIGTTKVLGWGVIAHGLDTIVAGGRAVYSGEHSTTMTFQAIKGSAGLLGASESQSQWTGLIGDSAIGTAGPAIAAKLANASRLFAIRKTANEWPLTGVARYDQLATESSAWQGWTSNLRKRGVEVVPDATLPVSTKGSYDPFSRTLAYNPTNFTYLDLLHESRHFAQFEKAGAKGLEFGKFVDNKKLRGWLEKGALDYEAKIGRAKGFSGVYMSNLQSETLRHWTLSFQQKYELGTSLKAMLEPWWK